MRSKGRSIILRGLLAIFAVLVSLAATATGQEGVLYTFDGTNGGNPNGSLIFDSGGNLYGTAINGGTYDHGTVFQLVREVGGAWDEKVLHTFGTIGGDGASPYAGLTLDGAGNLYGTTAEGGSGGCNAGNGVLGCGTVFELKHGASGGWAEKVLHSFIDNGLDGVGPIGGLILDGAGNLYGTTTTGGTGSCTSNGVVIGCGTVFELTPIAGGGWTETVLHSFANDGVDGQVAYAGLVFDAAGNLYGTTLDGGTYGEGTVFELTPATGGGWAETVLHSFISNGADGTAPYYGSLILDAVGNLYGTTAGGGSYNAGTAFELSPSAGGWTETILHNFGRSDRDGSSPAAGLIFDAAGSLYGTTYRGGSHSDGTAFELTPTANGTWTDTVLHSFYGAGGESPYDSLIFDHVGNLYGTAWTGGNDYGDGTVFEIKR